MYNNTAPFAKRLQMATRFGYDFKCNDLAF
jgi:hypothetical protein